MKRTMLLLAGLLTTAAIIWQACTADKPTDPAATKDGVTYSYSTGLQIGPIEGLTTRWHGAPDRFVLPSGVTLQLRCLAPQNAEVTWSGALETERDQYGSVAECPADAAGEQRVEVTITIPTDGDRGKDKPPVEGTSSTHTCTFSVSDFSVDEISVGSVELSREPLHVDENSTNMETVKQFFGGSIASVRQVGPDHYRTAVGTEVHLSGSTEPRAFAALTEWRIDGKAILLGERGQHRLRLINGVRAISVGPPANAHEITLETYSVSFTSDKGGIPIGVPVTFTATTDPRGLEDEIVWLASTKYGTAKPLTGEGESFTVTFDATRGPDGVQWLGVRANNTAVEIDNLLACSMVAFPVDDLEGVREDSTVLTPVIVGVHIDVPHTITWTTDNANVTLYPPLWNVNLVEGEFQELELTHTLTQTTWVMLRGTLTGPEVNGTCEIPILLDKEEEHICHLEWRKEIAGGGTTKGSSNSNTHSADVTGVVTGVTDEGDSLKVSAAAGVFGASKWWKCRTGTPCPGDVACEANVSVDTLVTGIIRGTITCDCP